MLTAPFVSEFYTIFPAPNADELIEFVNKTSDTKDIDNDHFEWGSKCKIDRIPIPWQDAIELYKPSMELLYKEFSKSFSYNFFDPWINLYKKGYYQEIHAHKGNDISSVFFANDGENFSKFFFVDRQTNGYSLIYDKLISHNYSEKPKIKAGDIMFFSSNLFHGVSPHKNDIIRKTLSVNFNIRR